MNCKLNWDSVLQSNLDIGSLNITETSIKRRFLYHELRMMWYDYLRCLYSFLKIEVDLCFKFDLREALYKTNFEKETMGALKLRFDFSTIKLRKSISKIQFNGMSKVDWFTFTLINFRSISEILLYERINDLMSLLTISFKHIHLLALRAYRRSECVC